MSTSKAWYWWWFLYLRANAYYESYCVAFARNDVSAVREIEEMFPNVRGLYVDWGDIYRFKPKSMNDASWREWFRARKQLFIAQDTVRRISSKEDYSTESGHLILDIPMSASKAAVMRKIDEFLTRYFESEQVVIPTGPKYALYAPKGRLDKTMLERAQKAYYINMHRRLHQSGKQLSIADTALEIAKAKDKWLGWSLDQADRDDLEKGTFKKLFLGSEVTQIKRYRKDYEAYVRNTIHGRFPDNT